MSLVLLLALLTLLYCHRYKARYRQVPLRFQLILRSIYQVAFQAFQFVFSVVEPLF